MYRHRFFAYQWHIDDNEPEITSIRIYGLNEQDENVCVRVDNFTPYVYLELSEKINWKLGYAQLLGNKIDEMMGDKKPISKMLMYKYRLYGAHMIKDDNGEWVRKKFPYLFCSFSSRNDAKILGYKIKNPINIPSLGPIRLKMHEQDADPILQLTCCKNIPTAGWIEFKGKEIIGEQKLTLCEKEYNVLYANLGPYESDKIPSPKIMSFDFEVNSTNPNTMPNSSKPGDKIFQASCVIGRSNVPVDKHKKYLLTLGDPDPLIVGEDVIIQRFDTESDLLIGWKNLIRTENPNLLAGYNIMTFDIPYMVDRAKLNLCIFDFDQLGFHKYAHAREKEINWSSSAYKNQKFSFLDAEGRLFVDLLPLVRRDYKLNTYKLKVIADMFIGETKDPLTPKGIFKCYRIGMAKKEDGTYSSMARKAVALVGRYCVQDSVLVSKLLDKRKDWFALAEMAKVCQTPIFALYTQGQQIKVYSQLYKFAMYNDIVVEKDAYFVADNERYVGAYVFPPVPGKYENVIPEDFASLYPSVMIAYNIDYHSWVKDDSDIPDSMCHVHVWDEHLSCPHDPKVIRKNELTAYIDEQKKLLTILRQQRDSIKRDKVEKDRIASVIKQKVEELKPYTKERSEITKTLLKHPMCAKRSYRFLKEPLGALPSVVKGFLDARAAVRRKQGDVKKKINELKKLPDTEKQIIELELQWDILEKRQLAYKVSANSSYGATGVKKGYLPFMPAAMCITYVGRKSIMLVAETIQKKYKGHLVYGDTDSNYVNFPHLKTSQEVWDIAEKISAEISLMFPPPMKLEFEKKIYSFFLIITKKRYMYRECDREGNIKSKIGSKGVLLARRDNSNFVRSVYETVIGMIADGKTKDEVFYYVLCELNLLCSHSKPLKDFIITKAVGDIGDLVPVPFVNEKGKLKAKIGNYTVPILEDATRDDQFRKKSVDNEHDYYLSCLPAQVQLAERMRKRGQRVDPGTRLEYVVADPENHTANQYKKVESAEYIAKFGEIIKIDYLYYIHALATPLDQVLSVVYKEDQDFVLKQYKYRWQLRKKLIDEINNLFRPKFIIEDVE